MDLSPVTARLLSAAAMVLEELQLRPGAEVVARVVHVPRDGGAGLLSLAGRAVWAKLPPGLTEGQKLLLTVGGKGENGEVLLRLRSDERPREEAAALLARLAGALATSGSGELVRAALELAGPAAGLPLPDGGAASVHVDADAGETDARAREGDGEARVVLHSPRLGAIELHLRLGGGSIRASVAVEPGEAHELAEAAAPELRRALAEATGGPAAVDVGARTHDTPRPGRPAALEALDVYA